MDLTAIQTEVKARVSDTASTTRLNYWINSAYRKAVEREAWEFLSTSATGSSPLTILDLRAVLAVIDTTNTNPLAFIDRRDILNADPALTQTGPPTYWYQSSATVIGAWPTTSVTLKVYYLKVPTDLSSGTDVPLIPTRYQYDILVEGACMYAYRDSDNWEAAQACRDAFDTAILEMTDALQVVNFDGARELVTSDASTDW